MIFPVPMRLECAVLACSGVMVPETNLRLLAQINWWNRPLISRGRFFRWSVEMALRRGRTGLPRNATSQFVPFLAQRLGEARAEVVGRLAARFLADLVALQRQRRRLLQQLLPGRLAIERLYLVHLVDREIAGI